MKILVLLIATLMSFLTLTHIRKKPNTTLDVQSLRASYTELCLPIIKPAPCLQKLLFAIVKSNRKHYNPSQTFYRLEFIAKAKYNYLGVNTENWHSASKSTYKALINLDNATFLCSGNILNSKLFFRQSYTKECVKIQFKDQATDQLLNIEPALQGTLNICESRPLYIEIYISEPIQGYTMHFKKH